MRYLPLLAALVAPAAFAQITVTTLDDELNADGDCSFREAIEAANTDSTVDACVAGSGADAITFGGAFDGATLALTLGELVLSDEVRLGAFDSPFVTLVAAPGSRHLRIVGGRVSVDRMGFRAGQADRGGAVLVEAGAVRFSARNSVFESNASTGAGGGAIWIEGGEVGAAYSSFHDNRAMGGAGGAVYVAGGSFSTGNEVLFAENSATNGGAVAVLGGEAYLGFADFRDNLAILNGGALFVKAGDDFPPPYAFLQVTRFGTNAARNGGAVWADGHLEARIPDIVTQREGEDPSGRSMFEGNSAFEHGGAIYLADPATTLDGLHLRENLAGGSGGGLYVANGSSVRVERSIVVDNQAGAADLPDPVGAGIAVMDDPGTDDETNLWLIDSWVDGNGFWKDWAGLGGGLYIGGDANARVARSTLSNNRAATGAGIWTSEHLYLDNSTLTRNVADERGGALYVGVATDTFSTTFLSFATIAGNEAGVSGGGIGCPVGEGAEGCFVIGSTILANNTAAGEPSECDGRGWTTANNLVLEAEGCIVGGTLDGYVIEDEDPLLQALALNGGLTPTMALEPGSPAEDEGSFDFTGTVDQRGFLRPGRPDLGAYEIEGVELDAESAPETRERLAIHYTAPNPVQATARVGFEVATPGPARLVLHDVLGRAVRTLFDGQARDEHEATFDVGGLAPGIYVLRLTSEGQQVTRKLTIVR